jgi:hypothetical protein
MLVCTLVTSSDTAQTPDTGEPDEEERHRLTTLSGLAALSLDALSSVAYGPEAIVVVLVAAGTAGLAYTLPVTVAIGRSSRRSRTAAARTRSRAGTWARCRL